MLFNIYYVYYIVYSVFMIQGLMSDPSSVRPQSGGISSSSSGIKSCSIAVTSTYS